MKVIVTGGAGFIGHHLVSRLHTQGHSLTVLDNLRRGSFERPGMTFAHCIEGDVRDFGACRAAFEGADAVVHLAAQANVMGAAADPDYTYATNVTGTWNVLRAAEATSVPHLVFASSREVYGDPAEIPVAEAAPRRPKNLYGASKLAGEALLVAGGGAYPGVTILRLANVIGPGDSGRVVPTWLDAARAGAPLRVFGGTQVLDLVPVDFVTAVIATVLAEGPDAGSPMNVGSGVEVPIIKLAAHILEKTCSRSRIEIVGARGQEVERFCADTSRMSATLGLDPPSDPLASIEVDW